MDDVPIANNNPIKTTLSTIKLLDKKPPKKETFKDNVINWVYMFPLASIAFFQLYKLGQTFSAQTTLPITSFTSYIYIGLMIAVLLVVQTLMRSITYSVICGLVFVCGLFNGWFGDFIGPIATNYKDIVYIVKAAWTRKDIPYELLTAGIMGFVLISVPIAQFFLSLIVKSFFETIFGKEWGNGKLYGFAGAIIALLAIQLTFSGFRYFSSETSSKLIWKYELKNDPVEKFITLTPYEYIIDDELLRFTDTKHAYCLELASGDEVTSRTFNPSVYHKGFKFSSYPVLFGNDGLYAFNTNLSSMKKIPYPQKIQGLNLNLAKEQEFNPIPLTSYSISKGKELLVFYDYGCIGLYNASKGKELWLTVLDLPKKNNRAFPDKFLEKGYFLEIDNSLVFSCNNGIIKCLSKKNGSELWKYEHSSIKHNGVSLRGYISSYEDYIIVAYKNGDIITLDTKTGKKVYRASHKDFEPMSPVCPNKLTASFLSKNGIFYTVALDGGQIMSVANMLEVKNEYAPIIHDNTMKVVLNGGRIAKTDNEGKTVEVVLNEPRHVFVTQPKFDDKIMYAGTSDGLVYCIHIGSKNLKWVVKVDGELTEDSLYVLPNSLLVKTKSGSVYCFRKDFRN